MTNDLPNRGLFLHYNRHNNNNTLKFKAIITSLEKLNYKF